MKKILLVPGILLTLGCSCYAADYRLTPPRYSETVTDASHYGAGDYRKGDQTTSNYNPFRDPETKQVLHKTTSGTGIDQGQQAYGQGTDVYHGEWNNVPQPNEWGNVSQPGKWESGSRPKQWGAVPQSNAAKLLGEYAHESASAPKDADADQQEETEQKQ